MNNLFYLLATIILCLTPIIAFGTYKSSIRHKHVVFPYKTVMALVFIVDFLIYYPYVLTKGYPLNYLSSLIESLRMAIGCFIANQNLQEYLQYIGQNIETYQSAIVVLVLIMHIISPLTMAAFVLSFFKSAIAYLTLSFRANNEKYVFSEYNERSLILAQSIHKAKPKALLIFMHVKDAKKEELSKIAAISFKADITEFRWERYKALKFFLLSNNNNLQDAARLIDKYQHNQNIELYIFSLEAEAEALFSSSIMGGMKIRRIDPTKNLINQSFFEDGYQIFDEAIDKVDHKLISIVILGLGKFGTRLATSLTWLCQISGYELDLHIFDIDPQAYNRFKLNYPELVDSKLNGQHIEGESYYNIHIYPGVDVKSLEFKEQFDAIKDISRVYVMLGDDLLNLNTAINIRKYSEAKKSNPNIIANIENLDLRENLVDLRNYRNNSYRINFTKDIRYLYSYEHIFNDELEALALKCHLAYKQDQSDSRDFYAYEYNYQSSIAQAISTKLRHKLGLTIFDKPLSELNEQEREEVESLEHKRWNAYMRSIGYRYSGSLDASSRNDIAKLHHNLVPFQLLSENDKRKDSNVAAKK